MYNWGEWVWEKTLALGQLADRQP